MSRDASGLNPAKSGHPSGAKDAPKSRFRSQLLARSAFWISFGTLTSRILGLFRDIAMAALFDRAVTDAWTAAFRLPNLFRRLFGEGSLAVSFIPVFVDLRSREAAGAVKRTGTGSASPASQNLVNGFFLLLLGFMGTITALGLLWTEPLLALLLDPAYLQNRENFELTLLMARIMFSFIFFIVNYSYFMALLQALGEFAWPALAPALFNITMLVFTFLPASWFGRPGEGLAWGVLIGGLLQSVILLPILKRHHFVPALRWGGFSLELRRLVLRLLPGVLAMGLIQVVTIVNLHFASGLGEGVLSAMYWADRLLELPLSLVAVSLSAALLPALAEMWTRGERRQILETAQKQIIVAGFWVVPAMLGLYFMAGPIVETLFFRGQFSGQDLLRTTQVLQIYAGSLLSLTLVRLMLPVLFAAHIVWRPAFAALVALLIHLVSARWWMNHWGLRGLIGSTLLCSFVYLFLLLALVRRHAGPIHWWPVIAKYLQFAVASAGSIFCPWLYMFLKMETGSGVLSLATSILFGVTSYWWIGNYFGLHPLFSLTGLKSSLKSRT